MYWALALVLSALVLVAPPARAHGMRTAFVELTETSPGVGITAVRPPPGAGEVVLELPPECDARLDGASTPRARISTFTCPWALAGRALAVRGLGPAASEAIVSATLADGSRDSHVVTAAAPTWTLPARASWAASAWSYAGFGLTHVATGADHLLFLLLLVLTLRRPLPVLAAETAFTASHALSFAATTLGWVRVAPAPVEACIALSLILLALDVGRPHSARVGEVVALAFVFGLVHGLGFAGGLREIGLPERDVGAALLGFAGGLEVGQASFVLAALGVTVAAERARVGRAFGLVSAYASGAVASLWFLQRCLAVLEAP